LINQASKHQHLVLHKVIGFLPLKQRRGLNQSGKATAAEIEKAVQTQNKAQNVLSST